MSSKQILQINCNTFVWNFISFSFVAINCEILISCLYYIIIYKKTCLQEKATTRQKNPRRKTIYNYILEFAYIIQKPQRLSSYSSCKRSHHDRRHVRPFRIYRRGGLRSKVLLCEIEPKKSKSNRIQEMNAAHTLYIYDTQCKNKSSWMRYSRPQH